jgi:glycosyltransferase involved in cell wall biosynthesis
MDISIIICCYNSEGRIGATLEHLAKQILPDGVSFEVILVDNNCTDRTVDVAKEVWGNNEFELVVLKESTPGPAAARRCGLNYAQSEYLLCCDDDNWLDPNYLAIAYAFLRSRQEYAAVGGWGDVVTDATIPEWFDLFKTKYACGKTREEGDVDSLITAGLFLRKSMWNELIQTGFTPILAGRKGTGLQTGEDIELTYAIRLFGWKLYFSEALLFQHYMAAARLTDDYVVRMALGHARSRSVLGEYRTRLLKGGNCPPCYGLVFNLKLWSRCLRSILGDRARSREVSLAQQVRHASDNGSKNNDLDLIKSGDSWRIAREMKHNFKNLQKAALQRRAAQNTQPQN